MSTPAADIHPRGYFFPSAPPSVWITAGVGAASLPPLGKEESLRPGT